MTRDRFFGLLAWVVFAICFAVIASKLTPRDDSDSLKSRSGMAVRIDHLTGCEYLQGFP